MLQAASAALTASHFETFYQEEFFVSLLGRALFKPGVIRKLILSILVSGIGLSATQARASATLLLSEPFGRFGTMMPVGHAGVYLDHVCADTPTHLRLCRPGETGIVLSRYHRVANIDWLAIPILPFLYGVDRPEDVPQFMTLSREAEIREQYRLRYLRDIVPDGPGGGPAPKGEWVETIGVTFDRRVWAYQVETTPEQDQHLIDTLNDRPNIRAYKLRTANCADFAANMIDLLYPGMAHRDKVSDFGLMTPKQVAKSMVEYSHAHSGVHLRVMEIPQVAGSLPRSRPAWGTAEAGLKTKRYLFSLIVLQPEVIAGCAIVYFDRGRWKVGQDAVRVSPDLWVSHSGESIANSTGAPTGNHPPETKPAD
jgi:hypothetical protein